MKFNPRIRHIKNGNHPLKKKEKSLRPDIGMWVVYPVQMGGNVCAMHLEFDLGECISTLIQIGPISISVKCRCFLGSHSR